MVDIKSMSLEELKTLAEDVRLEMKKRDDMRFKELASAVVDAIKALKAEFPYARYEIEVDIEDGDCGIIDVDILDFASDMSVSRFWN